MKKLVILATLALMPEFAQTLTTAYSRQADEVPKAYVGVVPKDVAVYLASTCNDTTVEQRFFPDRVIQEAAKTAPIQDGAAILFAAQTYKNSTWKAVLYDITLTALPMASAGLAAVNIGSTLGKIVAATGGTAVLTSTLTTGKNKATLLSVPANWWQPHQPERVLKAGECDFTLFSMSASAPAMFVGSVGVSTPPPVIQVVPMPNGASVATKEVQLVVYTPDGTVDVKETIMAARKAQAAATSALFEVSQ